MGRLIFSGITSLDGYINDDSGSFDWAMPDLEVHTHANEAERTIGTHIYGRRLYETMVFWQTAGTGPDDPPVEREYAELWRAADNVVVSTTLAEPLGERTRLLREFDPMLIQRLAEESDADVVIGGADLGGQALRAGLVDEVQQYLFPVIVGGGTRFLPDLTPGEPRIDLELVEQRRFESGVVFLRYLTRD